MFLLLSSKQSVLKHEARRNARRTSSGGCLRLPRKGPSIACACAKSALAPPLFLWPRSCVLGQRGCARLGGRGDFSSKISEVFPNALREVCARVFFSSTFPPVAARTSFARKKRKASLDGRKDGSVFSTVCVCVFIWQTHII